MNEKEKQDYENQIHDFLKNFTFESSNTNHTNLVSFSGNSLYDRNDIANITMAQYSEIEIPLTTYNKIQHLQKITNAIELRVVKDYVDIAPERLYQINYKNALNKAQYLAVTTLKGAVLVIAGAGTGKTRTIIYRLSYLLECGVAPENILLLTFTRKASNEMVYRANLLLKGRQADRVIATTFHSLANNILRRYGNILNIPPNFSIIDESDAEDIVDLVRQELQFDKKNKAFPRKERIYHIISKSRNCNLSIKQVIEQDFWGAIEFINEIELIAKAFKAYKRYNFTYDYDDLMELLKEGLEQNLTFRLKIQQLYQFIMVDEFQDTNFIQKQIIDLLATLHGNVMVVGDDSQSIYAFRGANFENILRFPETYKHCQVIKLEENYRSNQSILDFTNNIANKAVLGYQKNLFSKNSTVCLPVVSKFYNQEEEAEFIANKILELREKDIPLNEMAILYRSSYHSNYIQSELMKRNIPYIVVGGIKFIEKRQIKDIISYLRIIQNPFDAVAWNRILKLLPGIGKVSASKIILAIKNNNGLLNLEDKNLKKAATELNKLQQVLNAAAKPEVSVASKIELIKNYYTPILKSIEPDADYKLEDIEVLYSLSTKYDTLSQFLSDFALDPPSNRFQNKNTPLINEQEDKPIVLSTIHSAKGLEWYAVFVIHLLDGLFPSNRSLKHIEEIEEERRLFYVACTRAKEQIYLTMPSFVSSYDSFFTLPSRFIIELDKDKFDIHRK